MQRLTNVVLWKARANPANRVIPPHLKLAILSRGRIKVPADRINFFLDVARAKGATWPDGLTKSLGDIAPDYPVTIELFLNQRLTMTPDEIREAIEGYLLLRHEQHLKAYCWMLLFVTIPAVERKTLENKIDIDITELFRRPQVVLRPKDNPFQYVLVCYGCLPPVVAKFIPPQKKTLPPPPPLSVLMPPIDGLLKANTEVHLRKDVGKSTDSMGVQAGTAARVRVLDKQETEGELWYNIELLDPVRVVQDVGDPLNKAKYLPTGTKGWIVSWGLDILVASWALLRNDLVKFDEDNKLLSLGDRITVLRQRMHASDLPFDHVIGTKKGTIYLDKIPFEASRWQLGRDYQAFIAPDGRWVDLQHLMIGMDVLSRKEASIDYLSIPIGTNYAAATWSGDVGSAAAEATLHSDLTTWERWNLSATESARVQYYFSTRAPDHDLLGDLDAWGIQRFREADRTIDKIDSLFTSYYEELTLGGIRPATAQRHFALERFLEHYGFTYDPEKDYKKYPVFPNQKRPAKRFAAEIDAFARIWMLRQNPNLLLRRYPNAKQPRHIAEMTILFLWWLEYQTIENGTAVL